MKAFHKLQRLRMLKRRLTPSTNQVLLAGILFILVYARAEGDKLPSFMLYTLAAVLLAAWIWTLETVRGLKFNTGLETERSQVGQSFILETSLLNSFFLSVPWMELIMHIPPEFDLAYGERKLALNLARGETRSLTYNLSCRQRGLYLLGSASVRLGDLFGIFVRQKELSAPRTMIVYPRIIHLPRLAIPACHNLGNVSVSRAANEDLSGPTGARMYVHGDPVNRIHWRATAKTGQLQVKEYDLHTTAETGIFLNLCSKDYQGLEAAVLESAVTVAASIADYCQKRRLRFGLVSNGKSLYTLPPSRDSGQFLKTLEHLAVAEEGEGYSFAKSVLLGSRNFVPGTTLLLITPNMDEELNGTLRILRQRGYGIALVQMGSNREWVELEEGIAYFPGVTDDNLVSVLGGGVVEAR